jgi:hypothetical protein
MNAGSETLPDIPRLSSINNAHSHAAFAVKSKQEKGEGRKREFSFLFLWFALGKIAV